MIALKQSTASQELPLGFFVDSGDGNSEETGLTIANTDIKLWKAGATTLADKNSGGGTHISNGIYYAVLDATDTNTAGPMRIFVHKSGALPFWVDCWVFPANVYDSLFSTDLLQVDVTQLLGTAWLTPGTAGTPDVNVKLISDDVVAANNLEAACDGGSYNVGGGAIVASSVTTKTGYALTAAYDAAKTAASQTSVNTIDDFLDTEVAAILADTNELQTDLVNGGRLDLLIDGIKAKTDNIPASPAAVGSAMTLADDAISAGKFDESTAFPLKSADTGSTAVARVGADSDTLETLSDQIDAEAVKTTAIKAKTDMFPAVWYNTA